MQGPFRHEAELELQLRTMDTSHFDLRIVNPQGKVVEQRAELFLAQIKDILEWLHEKNVKGNAIELRPSGEHGLSLISGLSHQQVEQGKLAGYEPALVVQYAPQQFQVWLKHDRKLSGDAASRASDYLCRQLGGDVEHSQWNSFGNLAGFLLPADGKPFRVELVAHSGAVFSESAALNERRATG